MVDRRRRPRLHARRWHGHPAEASLADVHRRVDAVGLPRIGVHGLRHTWATLALRAGVPLWVVSERIGHSDPAVTMSIYAHALDGDDQAAAETAARAIFG